jgi:hypothetical protein
MLYDIMYFVLLFIVFVIEMNPDADNLKIVMIGIFFVGHDKRPLVDLNRDLELHSSVVYLWSFILVYISKFMS